MSTESIERRLPNACYERIRNMVYQHSRINLGDKKLELVQSRLAKRLRALDLPDYESYCDLIESPRGQAELEHMINAISTNHTFFFREASHFEFMEQRVLPEYIQRGTSRPFHLWSAACSSGEEAYTTAIVMSEFFRKHGEHPWRIECSDISSKILGQAQQGIYAENKLQKIPKDVLRRYFQKGFNKWDGYFRVKSSIRAHVNFQLQNLLKPPYPFREPFDLIFCRNVMIYFDRPTQQELVNHLADYLSPGGYLMIGHSESLTGVKHPYQSIAPAIYRKP